MKYLFIFFMFIALVIACKDSSLQKYPTEEEREKHPKLTDGYLEEVTIDSCQYILYGGYGKGGIVHKANCKNHK